MKILKLLLPLIFGRIELPLTWRSGPANARKDSKFLFEQFRYIHEANLLVKYPTKTRIIEFTPLSGYALATVTTATFGAYTLNLFSLIFITIFFTNRNKT